LLHKFKDSLPIFLQLSLQSFFSLFIFSLSFSFWNHSFQIAASIGGDTVLENLDPTVHIVFGQKLFRFRSDIDVLSFVVLLAHLGVKASYAEVGEERDAY
jgi:hypothetical protein